MRGPSLRSRPLAVLLAAAGLGVACAGDAPPWDVRPSERPRFEEVRRLCHALTDEDGHTRPQAFERCMERRGFRRQAWWRFWN